jgi:hypothetical protein
MVKMKHYHTDVLAGMCSMYVLALYLDYMDYNCPTIARAKACFTQNQLPAIIYDAICMYDIF